MAACSPPGGPTITCDNTTNQNNPDGFGTPALDNNTINVLTNKKVEGDNDGLNIGTGNTVNNNGTIYGNGSSNTGNAAGIEAAGSLTVNNASGATIKGLVKGIAAANGSTTNVTNNGAIVGIDAVSGATGIFGDTVNLVNNGQILGGTGVQANIGNITNNTGATITGSERGVGISTGIANILNNGTVSSSGDFSRAIDTNTGTIQNNGMAKTSGDNSIAVRVNDDATINNSATGTIQNTSGGGAWAIRAENNVTVNNDGLIVANNSGGTGIAVSNIGTIANSKSGMISANGDGGAAAIFANTFGTVNVTNAGAITANGDGGTGVLGRPFSVLNVTNTSTGTITATGDGGAGIFNASSSVNVTNNGFIVVGKNGTGISGAGGSGNPNDFVLNTGTIIGDTGAFGVQFQGDSGALINSGTIKVLGDTGATVNICSCATNNTVTNLPTGVLDGRITIRGGGNTLTNSGLVTITDPSTTIGPGAFGNYVIQQNAGANNTFIQTSTGTLALRMNKLGAVDQLIADALSLTGTLRIVIQPQLYPNVLTSTNKAVQVTIGQPPSTTTFSSFVASSPFFTVMPIYTGTASSFTGIDIQLGRIPFGSVPGQTRNQQAIGNALESGYSTALTGVAATFFVNLLALSSVGVLDQISGEGTAALQNASFAAGTQFNYAALNQLVFGDTSGTTSIIIPPPQYAATPRPRGADAFDSVLMAPPAPATKTGRWRLWTAGFSGYRTIDGNAVPIGSANQTIRNYGGAFGFDYKAAPDLLLGFAAGGSEANVSVPDRATTGRLTGGHLGVYGLKTWGATYFAASANYARLDNSTTRVIAGLGPTENAAGKFASDQLSARLELGWKRAFANYTLTPFVAIEPAALWSHGYTETSTTVGGAPGVLGLTFAPRTTTSLPTFLGVQADTRIAFANGAVVTPYVRASWVHEFEPTRQVTATLVSLPGAAFTVDGARPASDSGRLDAGSKIQLDTTRSLFANLSGEWSGISQSYSAMAGFKAVLQ